MRIKNVTSKQWKLNHDPAHEDKWCRELYPFHVFSKIDFDATRIDQEQKVIFNHVEYYIKIKKIELQPNLCYKATFELSTVTGSKYRSWKYRSWNSIFQLVYSDKLNFITVFTRKKDPSKDLVVRFMKGNFQKISESKSLPISELLFRTLILHLSEESFPYGEDNKRYKTGPTGVIYLPEHEQFKRKESEFAPIYSKGRDLWICYSFTEEKAHRIAYHIGNQAKKLIIVFCNPTYTSHHRCTFENTSIVSLFEFANLISPAIRINYENQIKLLQNHLSSEKEYDAETLLEDIDNPKKPEYPIEKSDMMEALGIMKIIPSDNFDFFHSLACLNLINAFISREIKNKTLKAKEKNLFRNMYYFKTYLQSILVNRIEKGNFTVPLYIKGILIIIEIFDFQISFHNIPMNDILKQYEQSEHNKEIIWNEIKLQPIAPLLLKYSRILKRKKLLPMKPTSDCNLRDANAHN